MVHSLLYSLTSCKIRIISKILKENYYMLITSVPSNIMFVFLFFGSKQHSASIFIADTRIFKGSQVIAFFYIYTNDMPFRRSRRHLVSGAKP